MEYQNNVLPFVHAEADATATETTEKPTLTEEQKKLFNDVFRERYSELEAKKRKDIATALEEQAQKLKADFETKLAEATTKKVDKPVENVDESAEAKRIVADHKRLLAEREKEMSNLSKELEAQKSTIKTMAKDRAITDAMSAVPFVNAKQVKVLTGDAIELDPDSGNYVVRNEEGHIVMGDDFRPISLKNYFITYGEQNPHLVKSGVIAGAGSTTNGAPGTPGEFAHIKSKADLQGRENMQLRIRYVEKFGPEKFEALPLR